MRALTPPVSPMLARLEHELPVGDYFYEPKWDGFRCIVFPDGTDSDGGGTDAAAGDGGRVVLTSRNERPLTRYFPELVGPLTAALHGDAVVDGEIVVAGRTGLDFDALLQRLHPAASRVQRLASATPASFVAFDLLALGERELRNTPFRERRRLLVETLGDAPTPVHVTPSTTDLDTARDWFDRFEGAGLDGVVAKAADLPYREGERVMVKVKHERTADCVVGGWRRHAHGGVGSLLLGLYDGTSQLRRVGVCSGFSAARRAELESELASFGLPPGAAHPWLEGGSPTAVEPASRWTRGRDTAWEPLAPLLVCEVAYDHLQGPRFRHATAFRRWRPDRSPESCTFAQLEVPVPAELAQVFAAARD